MNPDAALDFLEFVSERHKVWERRQRGEEQPWTENPILASRKFTNVFRVLDPGSQFLLEELYNPYDNERVNLMRFFLYRHTGRVETWDYLHTMMGRYPDIEDLPEALELLKTYRSTTRRPVFTSAYLVYPQSDTPGTDKLESIFALTTRLFSPESHDDIVPRFLNSETQADRFSCLRRNKGVADFMSMQILTDWGYTTEFREDDFVVCGPGALKGLKALGGANHMWAVRAVRDLVDLPLLEGRPPSWMDVQNCLCEFSKYSRWLGKSEKSKAYEPAHPGVQKKPTLPVLW